MPKFIKRISKKTGSSPGTLIHIGEKRIDKVKITVTNYDKEQLQEQEISTIKKARQSLDAHSNTWINVEGINDVDFIKNFENHFQTPKTLQTIHNKKREIIYMCKQVWPIRELINGIGKAVYTLYYTEPPTYYYPVKSIYHWDIIFISQV